MECKGCHRGIVEDQYRLVAEWPFCLECFERLGSRPEPKSVAADEPSAAGAFVPARTEIAAERRGRADKPIACAACAREMTAADVAQMGQLGICLRCRQELIIRPIQKVLEREELEAEAREDHDREARAAAAAPIPKEEIFTPGTAGKKRCTQCDRRLLEPGGYEVINGQPYCPDCGLQVHAKAAGAGKAAAPVATQVRTEGPVRAACDACDRPLVAAEAAITEGFSLCRPCVSVDVEAALAIARARHRARLRKLRDELA